MSIAWPPARWCPARELDPLSCPWRFHPKKIKKLHLFCYPFTRGARAKSGLRKVQQDMKTLIVRGEKILEKRRAVRLPGAARSTCVELAAVGQSLANRLPVMRQVAQVARRRAFDGEKVPNAEKVFSIFEAHTELIKRGRRGKPIEFGHKVLPHASRKRSSLPTTFVLEKNRNDDETPAASA